LEFQVTSLPKSYFNIFKELVSKNCGQQRYKLYLLSAISFCTKPDFFRTLLLKSGCKDKRFIFDSPNLFLIFLVKNLNDLKICVLQSASQGTHVLQTGGQI